MATITVTMPNVNLQSSAKVTKNGYTATEGGTIGKVTPENKKASRILTELPAGITINSITIKAKVSTSFSSFAGVSLLRSSGSVFKISSHPYVSNNNLSIGVDATSVTTDSTTGKKSLNFYFYFKAGGEWRVVGTDNVSFWNGLGGGIRAYGYCTYSDITITVDYTNNSRVYIGDSSGAPHRVTKMYVGGSGNTPRVVTKVYIGDASGTPKLVWQK